MIHTWERTWQYIKKAGTVILAISIILWAMMTFPSLPEKNTAEFESQRQFLVSKATQDAAPNNGGGSGALNSFGPGSDLEVKLLSVNALEAEAALRYSIAGRIGTALETLSKWAGFDWRTNISLVGGFAAKEVIVATLGTAYSLGDIDVEKPASLSEKLANSPNWRPLKAFSLILFIMFYAPCFVTVVCIAREAGSWKWATFSIIFNTFLAFLIAVAVFQVGSLMGF
jgi:ferrous iron transport protein B